MSSQASAQGSDTVYTLEYVHYLAGKENSPATRILDSIDRREAVANPRTIPQYKIDLMRAYVVSRDLRPMQALQILHRIYPSPEIEQDKESCQQALKLLANEYSVLNRKDEAIKYSLASIEHAKANGLYRQYTIGLVNFWGFNYGPNNRGEAIDKIREARRIMRQNPEACDSTHVIWSLEVESSIQANSENIPEAIRLQQQLLSIYENMSPAARRGTEVEMVDQLRFKQAQAHATLALYYESNSRKALAAQHYEQSQALLQGVTKIVSPQMYNTVLTYLSKSGRSRKALEYALEYEKYFDEQDPICNYTHDLKISLSNIYGALGNYRNAWEYQRDAARVADSLHARNNQRMALELTTIYQTNEKQVQLISQQKTLIRNRFWIGLLAAGVAALLAICLLVWWQSRRILRKNRALFDQFRTLHQAKKELDRIHSLLHMANGKSDTGSDRENDLFDALKQCMEDKKLYLNPDLTREQVAAELNTNKLYLANAIQEQCSQTFGEYINQLRLEYACEMLMREHETKIEAIAILSGFNSVRTFYRLFQKTYLLTPSEFRSAAILHDR